MQIKEKNVSLDSAERSLSKHRRDNRDQKTYSKELPVFVVDSGGCTIEWTPTFSEAEEAFTDARAKASVSVLNQISGHRMKVYTEDPKLNPNDQKRVTEEISNMRRSVAAYLKDDLGTVRHGRS